MQVQIYTISTVAGREEACSVHTAAAVVAYIDAARKNYIACSPGEWCDAQLPPPRYRRPSSTEKTIADVENAVRMFIQVEVYVKEVIRHAHGVHTVDGGQENEGDEDEDEDEEDYSDMPALESF